MDTQRVTGTGAQETAEDIVGGTQKILDGLFDICSKSPHGKNKASKQYVMRFDADDAKMAIGLCAEAIGQIQRRLEFYAVNCA